MAYIDRQIRKLPYGIHRKLAEYLDPPGESDWRALIAAMPEDTYSIAQVNNLERVAGIPNGSPTQQILKDMGQKLKTVKQLVSYLDRIHNEEAMLLLRPHEPVEIIKQPEPVTEYAGMLAVLCCKASGFPSPHYQWFKDDQPLEHCVDHELRLENLALSDSGVYKCVISNRMNTQETQPVVVDVIPSGTGQGAAGGPELRQTASAKVALVIGNKDYCKDTECGADQRLQHTIKDSSDLSHILQGQRMQFKVISLANLNKVEIDKAIDVFCQMLGDETYALFYFAGHGFQSDGTSYMVPIDAQSNWAKKDCVSLDSLLQKVNQRCPKFCLCILDMCRKRGDDEPLKKDCGFWPADLNLAVAYATCPLSEAYERKGDENGLYMKYLKKYIEQNRKVEDVLHDVHQDIRREVSDDKQTHKMRPEFRTQTEENFCLLDPIVCEQDFYKANMQRDDLWLSLHKIPKPRIVNFEYGIKVEVGFDHFPGLINYLFLYIHVIDIGQSTMCDASIHMQIPQGLMDIFPPPVPELWNLPQDVQQFLQGHPGNVMSRSGPFTMPQNSQSCSVPYRRITQLHNIQRLSNNIGVIVRIDFNLQGDYSQTKYRPETFSLKEFGIYSKFL